MLGKKMQNMELSLTDLLVRQKQVTIGLPPTNEVIISQPLGSQELRDMISTSSQGDMTAASLTQEILCYLGMFVRTEPKLFHGMLRLRIGLILQVMISELKRSLNIADNEAEDKLLNLSPYETKNLLHHIMSGQEYNVENVGSKVVILPSSNNISKEGNSLRKHSQHHHEFDRRTSVYFLRSNSQDRQDDRGSNNSLDNLDQEDITRTDLWQRRRLLDGSLNRVPPGFYTRMWSLLLKCQGISVNGNILLQSITQEMTSGEMKFHLRCEALLNCVPDPGFRQLIVEAILVLILAVEHNVAPYLGGIINIDDIVREANKIFLEDLKEQGGICCAVLKPGQCGGSSGICSQFYDSAPSGPYGTMTYLVRAVTRVINTIPEDGEFDCNVM